MFPIINTLPSRTTSPEITSILLTIYPLVGYKSIITSSPSAALSLHKVVPGPLELIITWYAGTYTGWITTGSFPIINLLSTISTFPETTFHSLKK